MPTRNGTNTTSTARKDTRLRRGCSRTETRPVRAISRRRRIGAFLLGQRRVEEHRARVTGTETCSARDRSEVFRTGAVEPRVEAEGAAGKVQRRPEAHAA